MMAWVLAVPYRRSMERVHRAAQAASRGTGSILLSADTLLRERALGELRVALAAEGVPARESLDIELPFDPLFGSKLKRIEPSEASEHEDDVRAVVLMTTYWMNPRFVRVAARGRFVAVLDPRQNTLESSGSAFDSKWVRQRGVNPELPPLEPAIWIEPLGHEDAAEVLLHSTAARRDVPIAALRREFAGIETLLVRACGLPTVLSWMAHMFDDGVPLPASEDAAEAVYLRALERNRALFEQRFYADDMRVGDSAVSNPDRRRALLHVAAGNPARATDLPALWALGAIDDRGTIIDRPLLDWCRYLGPVDLFSTARKNELPSPPANLSPSRARACLDAPISAADNPAPLELRFKMPRVGWAWEHTALAITGGADALFGTTPLSMHRFGFGGDVIWSIHADQRRPVTVPALAGESVLVGTTGKHLDEFELWVLDRATGAILQRRIVSTRPSFALLDGWLFSVTGKASKATPRGSVTCVELRTGRPRRGFEAKALSHLEVAPGQSSGQAVDVATDGRNLFVGYNYAVAAFSFDDGRVQRLWVASPAGQSARARVAVGDDVVASYSDDVLRALDRTTGELLWCTDVAMGGDDLEEDPAQPNVVLAGTLLVTIERPDAEDEYRVTVLDARSGDTIIFMRRGTRPSVVSDGEVVWICGGGKVSELDPRAASVRRSLEGEQDYAQAVRANGCRVFVTSDVGVAVWQRPAKQL